MNQQKVFIRVLLSPFIFLWGLILLLAGSLFPITLLVLISFICLLLEPFIWIFKKIDVNITSIEPFFDITKNNAINHFIAISIHIWGAFYVSYIFIKEGTIFSFD
jgi:hypothetical protein